MDSRACERRKDSLVGLSHRTFFFFFFFLVNVATGVMVRDTQSMELHAPDASPGTTFFFFFSLWIRTASKHPRDPTSYLISGAFDVKKAASRLGKHFLPPEAACSAYSACPACSEPSRRLPNPDRKTGKRGSREGFSFSFFALFFSPAGARDTYIQPLY
ncbi:hypothetical protein QBC33DRAFT_8341 [Phialemonium atrogriseum]|uniref:Transmembrane protein n=1 Tax=Phialemonium atrogriseum TaxID=1093897 RepID=A0AAJ0C918_9PEZI|nr:uncharacterized protein QBC33DRAFT_8341 [Phialemonium atrogriseum]KAK1772400.1 hypothetical protein QBC33DRAFT_8341 [Phialemonium atrogriseum]